MRRFTWVVLYVLAGGAIFWIPDIALHAMRRYDFSGLDMLILTIVLPLATITGVTIFTVCRGLWHLENNPRLIAGLMLLGIWLLGPVFMVVGATFTSGGLAKQAGWISIVVGSLFFPIFTFIMSTYDGT